MKVEPAVPQQFGDWSQVAVAGGVVNPQQMELINTLYAEVLNRSYVNSNGERVMLSIAYGKNQNDSFQVHKPEICYPSQGFEMKSNVEGEISTPYGSIMVRRLETKFGSRRLEPVTYWTTIGDHVVRSGTDKKIREMAYAADGYIADGLLFRISSIDSDSSRAFALHESFANDLLAAMTSANRKRFAGLGH